MSADRLQDLSVYTAASYDLDHLHEVWFPRNGLMRPDQLAAVCYLYGRPFWGMGEAERVVRDPGTIVSIGCGMGFLEAWLEERGHTVIGVDPSPGARQVYRGRTLVSEYPGGGDTILFVESLEHIPWERTIEMFERFQAGARIIIVNWPDYMPLEREPPYHLTRIDDGVYDELLERFARQVRVRRDSHLVFDRR